MLRRNFLATIAAAPVARSIPFAVPEPKPYTITILPKHGTLCFRDPPRTVFILPQKSVAFALIHDHPTPCTMFDFIVGRLYHIAYADNENSHDFERFSDEQLGFFLPKATPSGFYLTLNTFQLALRAIKRDQAAWWREHPVFHTGLAPFPIARRANIEG